MRSDMGACDFCGNEFQMRRLVEIGGDHYCPECKNDRFRREEEAEQDAEIQAFYYPPRTPRDEWDI